MKTYELIYEVPTANGSYNEHSVICRGDEELREYHKKVREIHYRIIGIKVKT